jgi:hypothetical protein
VRLPEAVLRLTLANVLALSGLKLVSVPDEILLAAACVAAILVGALLVREQRRWQERRRLAAQAPEPGVP